MDDHTSPSTSDAAGWADSRLCGFESPEGLRALLFRLYDSGPGAWRSDREAAELMRYTMERYKPLARRHALDAWEVASAAFEVMLTAAVRNADNPWAVVTRAVQITCTAEVRAAGLLVSTSKVRHTGRVAGFHDAIRLTDRERLPEYHAAFAVNPDDDPATDDEGESRVAAALAETVRLFASAGWDAAHAAVCVEHVAYRLADLSSRPHAVEVLRRDRTAPKLLGLPPRSWTALLRIVLGHPAPKYAGTSTGDGVLLRLLSGEPVDALRADESLMKTIRAAHPDKQRPATGQAAHLRV